MRTPVKERHLYTVWIYLTTGGIAFQGPNYQNVIDNIFPVLKRIVTDKVGLISNDVQHEQQNKKLETNKSKIPTPLRTKKSSNVTGRVTNPKKPAATLSEVSSNIGNLNNSFKDLQSTLIETIYNEKLSRQLDTMNKTMKSVLDENKTLNEKISKLTDNNIPAKSSIKPPENDPLYKMSNEIRELRKEVKELSEVNQEITCHLAELQEAYKKTVSNKYFP